MNNLNTFFLVLVVVAVTLALRFLPFILFSKKTPKYISYLGNVLPAAIIGMLVVYCVKDLRFATYPFGLPELIAVICVVLLHLWRKNTLISIFGGTVIYMILIQLVF